MHVGMIRGRCNSEPLDSVTELTFVQPCVLQDVGPVQSHN